MSNWSGPLAMIGDAVARTQRQGARPEQRQHFQWATVTGTDPLAVSLDSDRDPLTGARINLPYPPATLVPPDALTVGTRVWVQHSGRRVVVVGAAGGIPAPTIHEVGTSGEPPLLNSWSDATFRATYGRVRFYLQHGRVYIEGVIAGGTAGTDIFVLPVGFRPGVKMIQAIVSAGGISRVDILPAGNVNAQAIGTGVAYANLSGISFLAGA